MQTNSSTSDKIDKGLQKASQKKAVYVDGILPRNSLSKVSHNLAPKNSKIKNTPTKKLQKSMTLNRLAVKKPIRKQTTENHIKTTAILKNKKPSDYSLLNVAKNSKVIRAAKVPITHQAENKHTDHHSSSYVPRKKTEEMIQAQLHNATAHLMTFKKPNVVHHIKKHLGKLSKNHRRLVVSSSVFAISLLLIGAIVYSNLPGISIMLASRRAGFTAYIPSFTPNGYKIKNPIGYTPGKVVINFSSNTNDFSYSIEQKPTGWSSETLKEQVSSSNGTQYQTQYANGLTIYFTGDDTATWVDRGVLFKFQGNSGLSIDQIASIAESM